MSPEPSVFLTGPKKECIEWDLDTTSQTVIHLLGAVTYPMPNSSRLVLPVSTAPALRNRSTTVASKGLLYVLRNRDAHVVGNDLVQILSLMAINLPSSGDRASSVYRSGIVSSDQAR